MKTTEQIKTEVVNYLNKTSNHLFVGENQPDGFYKVLVEGDNFIVINGDNKYTKDYTVAVYSINDHITWYAGNAKNVIKHKLFLNRKLKSIKNFKSMKEKHDEIKAAIAGKTDRAEINKIVTSLVATAPVVSEEKKSFIQKLFGK